MIIADEHAVVRDGIVQVFNKIPNTQIVAQADNGLKAIAEVKTHKPHLLVVDSAMPLAKGIEVLAETRRWSPDTGVVLMTGFTSLAILTQWLDAGVDGVLLKSCQPSTIQEAFEMVLNGGKFIAPEAQAVLDDVTDVTSLTVRETEILSLLASGHRNQTIADRLGISRRTVEKHRSNLMIKLDVTTISELMTYALREGLLDEYKQL